MFSGVESSIGITSPLMDHGGTGVVQLNFRVQLLVAWIFFIRASIPRTGWLYLQMHTSVDRLRVSG